MKNDNAEKKMQRNATKTMDAIISDIHHASLCATPESLVEARDVVSSNRTGNGSTLIRGNKGTEGEDCVFDSSSSTSIARDEVALNMPFSYIGLSRGFDGETEAAAHIKASAEAIEKAREVGRVVLRNGGTYAAADAAATHVALLCFQDAIRPSSDTGVARTMAVGGGAGSGHASMTHLLTNIATTSFPTTGGGRGRELLGKLGLRGQGGNRRGKTGGRMNKPVMWYHPIGQEMAVP